MLTSPRVSISKYCNRCTPTDPLPPYYWQVDVTEKLMVVQWSGRCRAADANRGWLSKLLWQDGVVCTDKS